MNALTSLLILWDDIPPNELKDFLNSNFQNKNIVFSIAHTESNVRGFPEIVVEAMPVMVGGLSAQAIISLCKLLKKQFRNLFPSKKQKGLFLIKQNGQLLVKIDIDSFPEELEEGVFENVEFIAVKKVK